MKKILLLLQLIFLGFTVYSQVKTTSNPYPLISSGNWVQDKNYYLLTLFSHDKAVNKLLSSDAELAKLTQKKLSDLKASITDCKDAKCYTTQIKFSDDEVKAVSSRLTALYQPGNALDNLVKTKLIPSGTYILYKDLSPSALLVKAWEQDAAGINYAIGVYAEGNKPHYPQVDSISSNVNAKRYAVLIYNCSATLLGDVKNTGLFFEPALQAALLYLQINERNDPANYEPMMSTVNKAAIDRIKTVKWSDYPYSNILVPGAGPEEITWPLSAEGMLRCRLAAQQYHLKQAPFIMVSGGKVHPYKTKYNEAEEMKRYLVQTLHIPDNAIIMEPHARHTTTNMRNCARQIFRYGIPAGKPGIVITDKSQTDYILNMAPRCEKELGYVPYKLGKHVSDTEVEYYPAVESLQINPTEPLDPR
ncbi:YdcF family protein [Mucilaginibacter jinjuensis]|uniref:YdcF family protein n=1 Tax=Mucilaginibacter jinjuensis TaxID=1176721 RepID=A0ABY7T2P6_9SPHI|nr:YdcF family protein [Mucilaginibacter jinjuensis]WCT10667.1 YdcF family protein [Mucilaginibacter jinjuensis]